jgi:transposase
VHVKSSACRSWRALLIARRLVLGTTRNVENGLRALLREARLKLGTPTRKEFAARVRELTAADPMMSVLAEPLLTIIEAMTRELAQLTKRVLDIVRDEPVCRRLMGVPGVGPLTALAFHATSRRSKRRLHPCRGRGQQTPAAIGQTASDARATWARISA